MKRLVTSALPYVNNIPHLGNLIQVLSADVFARFCRQYGHETLYICGTDEYGTATETKAQAEGVSPKELCDRFNAVHNDIYKWFNISFDHFGRTSRPVQTEVVQDIFKKADANGYINEKTIEQLYCNSCDRFLADRYVHGTCPHCGYEEARGDQCENCGKLLEPTELLAPRCGSCSSTPEVKETHHLYLDLPKVLPKLQQWMEKASEKGFWANNAIKMTESWIRDGLHERCITRDLKWGIPVPRKGFEDKVFYVWFDAPIGYISMTADYTDDWESWWKDPENTELFQFIGKDNIPFHTVVFPSSLLASGDNWTMLHHMSSTEYMNYEKTKFSKSKGIGIFGNDCQDTGIPADVWRFYIYYNRPEKSDFFFTWKDLQEKVNKELIGNLGNLVNRTLTFISRFYDGKLPEGTADEAFWKEVKAGEERVAAHLDRAELKDGLKEIFALADMGNKAFQEGEPWRTRNEDPQAAADLLWNLVYLVKELAIMIRPYLPTTSDKLAELLGITQFEWSRLGCLEGLSEIKKPEILFQKLEDDLIEKLKVQYSGSQAQRQQDQENESPEAVFNGNVSLKAAEITAVENHPEADKLYVITLNDGSENPRTIVSGLVGHYEKEELLGKTIIVVANLKPAKLRGVKSSGMLLAADDKKNMEVLFLNGVDAGTELQLDGFKAPDKRPSKLSINRFFETPITVEDYRVNVNGKALTINGEPVKANIVQKGEVG